MGQQQLLLTILVIILVGVATVVALQMTDTRLKKSNKTQVRRDIQSIANSARAYYRKPQFIGGGKNDFSKITFDDTSFPKLEQSDNGLKTYNENGTYVIASRSSDQFIIKAYPSRNDSYDDDNPLSSVNGDPVKAVVKKDTIIWK